MTGKPRVPGGDADGVSGPGPRQRGSAEVPANVGRAQEITRTDAVAGRTDPTAGAAAPPPRRNPETTTEPAGSTTTTGRTPPPADRRGTQDLAPVPGTPDGGLIDTVGDRPVS